MQLFWRQWDGQRQHFLSEKAHLLRKVVSGPKEQEQKSPVGGFLQCFSRGDADLILPVVQWDSAVPRAGEFMMLSPCVVVCSAMATRAPHASSCGRCWVLLPLRLENPARFMRRGREGRDRTAGYSSGSSWHSGGLLPCWELVNRIRP